MPIPPSVAGVVDLSRCATIVARASPFCLYRQTGERPLVQGRVVAIYIGSGSCEVKHATNIGPPDRYAQGDIFGPPDRPTWGDLAGICPQLGRARRLPPSDHAGKELVASSRSEIFGRYVAILRRCQSSLTAKYLPEQ